VITAERLLERNRAQTEGMVTGVTDGISELAEQVVDGYGRRIVELNASAAAHELARLLKDRDLDDYAALGSDPELQAVAAGPVGGWREDVGYIATYDSDGVALWHPNPQVQGRNFSSLKELYPQMWDVVSRSYTEDNTEGYYEFPNEVTGEVERKFLFAKHVPGTQFRAAATVRIESFFDPVEAKFTAADIAMRDRLHQLSGRNSHEFLRRFFQISLAVGVGVAFLGLALGSVFSRAVATPLRSLEKSALEMRDGALQHQVPEVGPREIAALARMFNGLAGHLTQLLGEVQSLGTGVAGTVSSVGTTAREEEQRVRELETSTTEIAATSRQILATADLLAETVGEVADSAAGTAELATQGREGLDDMTRTMTELRRATIAVSRDLGVIRTKAGGITGIIGSIGELASKTNLLSLNAHIAAEEAGRYGRGFGVVAREMRRLADQTGTAARDVAGMVRAMEEAVATGAGQMERYETLMDRAVHAVARVAVQLEQIIANVQVLSPRYRQVEEGMQAQSEGAAQITDAVVHLDQSARSTGDAVATLRRSAEHLSEVMAELNDELSHFQVGVAEADPDTEGDTE
jgi:methyl-accepting chemotaxis protein